MQRVITVSGNAKVSKAPELAHLTVSASAKGKSNPIATTAQAKLMHSVLAACSAFGVPPRSMKTERYTLQIVQKYIEAERKHVPDGVIASQQLHITVAVDEADQLIEKLDVFAVEIHLGFGLKDHDKETNQALGAAVENARVKAMALALECKGQVGKVISCQEGAGQQHMPQRMALAMSPEGGGGGGRPELPAGDIQISAAVTVTFELEYPKTE